MSQTYLARRLAFPDFPSLTGNTFFKRAWAAQVQDIIVRDRVDTERRYAMEAELMKECEEDARRQKRKQQVCKEDARGQKRKQQEEQSSQESADVKVRVQVQAWGEEGGEVIEAYLLRPTSRFEWIVNDWCKLQSLSVDEVEWWYGSVRVQPQDTLLKLGWHTGVEPMTIQAYPPPEVVTPNQSKPKELQGQVLDILTASEQAGASTGAMLAGCRGSSPTASAVPTTTVCPVAPQPAKAKTKIGRPRKQKADDQESDEDQAKGAERSVAPDVFLELVHLVPKMRELQNRFSIMEAEDDCMGCAVVKNQIKAIKDHIASIRVCQCCYMEKPSDFARSAVGDQWKGPQQSICGLCFRDWSDQCTAATENSLRLRTVRDLMLASRQLQRGESDTQVYRDGKIKNLDKLARALMPKNLGKGHGIKVSDVEVAPAVVVGQLQRTKRRLTLEPDFRQLSSAVSQALLSLGAE